MSTIVHHFVRHDGGSAYEANDSYLETFPSRGAAHRAAEYAAREQQDFTDAAVA